VKRMRSIVVVPSGLPDTLSFHSSYRGKLLDLNSSDPEEYENIIFLS
jgi:hypothetical protein